MNLNSGSAIKLRSAVGSLTCDIQVKGTEHDTLSYVRYDSNSPAFVSFNTTTTASYNGTGSFSITAFCQGQPGGPWPALNLGFNNVRLLAAYDPTEVGAALTCGFKQARDTIQSATLQPYCSSLLSYSTPTTTLTEVISTTLTLTQTVNMARRKRSIITPAPKAVPDILRPRQLDVPANSTMPTSSTIDGAPSALATFAPQDKQALPNSGTADNRIYIEAPSSASYPLTCGTKGRTAGSYFVNCQSSGPPNGNPVVYGFGWCPSTQGLYMIPNHSNVRCGGGYAFLALYLVAYTGSP
ncbi:hypothetical protein D6C88_03999 [Aureobasidium pullulans]|nr:hypothetical protein D6C88_03999 [Aureobasidium pullulans]